MTSIPAQAAGVRPRPPLEIQVVSLDWKWLFIYPNQGVASVNQLVVPAGVPRPFLADVGERDERVLHPATRQHDLHDERHDDAAEPARRRARHVPRPVEPFQRRRLLRTCISRCRPCRRSEFATWIEATRNAGPTLDAASYAALAKQSIEDGAVHLPAPSIPICSSRSSHRSCRPGLARRPDGPTATVSPRTEQ